MKHLTHDYELSEKPQGFVPHFWDTIDSLGGPIGLVVLGLVVGAFHLFVVWFVERQRLQREAKKLRKRQ